MEDRSQPWAGGRNPVGIERALSDGALGERALPLWPWEVDYRPATQTVLLPDD